MSGAGTELVKALEKYGLLGLSIFVLALVIIFTARHIKSGIVEDRDNKRYHKRELVKLQAEIEDRRKSLSAPGATKHKRSMKSKGGK